MDAETGKFIEIFIMIIVPLGITLWVIGRRFEGHDEEIMELKNRINKIHEEQQHDGKFYCEYRDCRVTCDKTCKNCLGSSVDENGNFYCPYYKD